jgi:hypothetical protein
VTDLNPRQQQFWDLFDFGKGHGLEIGPLHRTVVPRDLADVSYADVLDREGLLAHYLGDQDVDPALIPEIDYQLIQPDGRTATLREAAAEGAPFDWVVASHVIEHVPDLLGWLDDIAELVDDEGALVLCIPDRRYTFDAHRADTTIGEMLLAHRSGDTVPSVRAVYDHFSRAAAVHAPDVWVGEAPVDSARIHGLDYALEKVARAESGEYIDSHVWIFTPDSFTWQMRELRVIGRSSWYLAELRPTPRGGLEFLAVLRRIPRDVDPTGEQPDECRPERDRPDWVDVEALEHRVAELTLSVERLETRLERRVARIKQLNKRLARQRRRAQGFERRLQEMTVARAVRRSVGRRLDGVRRRLSSD